MPCTDLEGPFNPLFRRGWPPGEEPAYDVDYALVACRLHNFRPGLLFLYEVTFSFPEKDVANSRKISWLLPYGALSG